MEKEKKRMLSAFSIIMILIFILGFLSHMLPEAQFIEKEIVKLKKDGVVWGYDMQYLITGILNQHPRTAIAFTKDKRSDFAAFYNEMIGQE